VLRAEVARLRERNALLQAEAAHRASAARASMKLKQVARPARGRKRVALRPARLQENEAPRLQLRAAKLPLKQHEAVRPGPADRAGFDGAGFKGKIHRVDPKFAS
jgi:hypothetical protein